MSTVMLFLIIYLIGYGIHFVSGLESVEDPFKATLARAERQHAQWMSGDDAGLYGDYPPADL